MSLIHVVRMDTHGGPEVLKLVQTERQGPAPGEVGIRQTAIGFNYIDVYQRKGIYPMPLPTGLGHEAVGVVERIGEGVAGLGRGDRVGYITAGPGAYADYRNVPASRLVRIPAGVSDEAAAALLFKGLTAQYLLRRTHRVGPGDLILVHAAAGGVGQILCRWATALGAAVIGAVGTAAKRPAAFDAGCAEVIVTDGPDWPERFVAAAGGRKARVVYDSVGRDTFLGSLDCAEPFGLVVLFGAASGPAPAIEPELLNRKGCLFLTRPSLFPHNADTAVLRANADELFDAIAAGHVRATIGARVALGDVAKVHAAAESRATTGATILVP
jgi:NADPH2:quinone reductase